MPARASQARGRRDTLKFPLFLITGSGSRTWPSGLGGGAGSFYSSSQPDWQERSMGTGMSWPAWGGKGSEATSANSPAATPKPGPCGTGDHTEETWGGVPAAAGGRPWGGGLCSAGAGSQHPSPMGGGERQGQGWAGLPSVIASRVNLLFVTVLLTHTKK